MHLVSPCYILRFCQIRGFLFLKPFLSKYSSHSKCDICAGLDAMKSTSKSQSALNYSISLKYNHRVCVSRSRNAINQRKQLALTFPNEFLFVAIDGMDNSKSYIPRFMEKTKKLSTWKLPSKITGAVISSGRFDNNRKVKLYVNHDHFPQGSNMVVSIVYKVILDFLKEQKMLPKVLDLNLDNCWRENKGVVIKKNRSYKLNRPYQTLNFIVFCCFKKLARIIFGKNNM